MDPARNEPVCLVRGAAGGFEVAEEGVRCVEALVMALSGELLLLLAAVGRAERRLTM